MSNIRKKLFVVDPSTKLSTQTLRHDFGEKFMEELKHFAVVHKFDDRKVFKEAWNVWANQNSIKMQIDEEVERLRSAGYKGDVSIKCLKVRDTIFARKKKRQSKRKRKESRANNMYLCVRDSWNRLIYLLWIC